MQPQRHFPCVILAAAALGTAYAAPPSIPHPPGPNDPAWISSYFGGSGIGNKEDTSGMVVDPATGDIIVVGETNSPDAPITAGAADTIFAGGSEGYVARFSADLGILRAATYFGGNGTDVAFKVALDPANGDVLIVGYTTSISLPGIAGAPQSVAGGDTDAFVARLSPDLAQVRQSTFLGRLGAEFGIGISVRERDGNIFIVGSSSSLTLPGSDSGAQSSSAGGGLDGFVARFSSDLRTLGATSFQGGNGRDDLFGLWIDPDSDDVVVAGATASTNLGNVAGAAQSQNAGGSDVQLARFSGTLGTRYRSSYYGGAQNDSATAMVFDPVTGGVLVAGASRSPALPGASGTSQDQPGGGNDGFVVRFATDLSARGRATFLGGAGNDLILDLEVAPDGQIVMSGATQSTQFPGTGQVQTNAYDAFIAKLPSDMLGNFSTVRWSSQGETVGLSLAQADTSRFCAGGQTVGSGLPYTAQGAQPTYGGGDTDGFVSCVKNEQFPIFVDGFD